jgi:hypothetical protein
VLHAASICAPIAFLDVPTTLAQASEFKTLAADIPAQPLAQAPWLRSAARPACSSFYVSSVISNQRSQAVAAGLKADEALAACSKAPTALRAPHPAQHPHLCRRGCAAPTTPKVLTVEMRDEVIISASRGAEKVQDVPITIQSISGNQLNQLNVTTT